MNGILRVVVLAVIVLCAGGGHAGTQIGVLLYSEEPRYAEAFRGVRDALAKQGFREPAVRFDVRSAGGSKAVAARIARDFRSSDVRMIVTLGTNATLAAVGENSTIPILFSMVYDPVESGVVQSWSRPGGNATGTSPKIEMSRIITFLRKAGVRRLLVLYTPSERNSEIQLKELLGAAEKGIEVEPLMIRNAEEISTLLPLVLPRADGVYVTGSSVIGRSIGKVTGLLNQRGVLSVTHLKDLVDLGVMVGLAADPYRLGLKAGSKGARILSGHSPSTIPVETDDSPTLHVNDSSLRHARITIPPELLRGARHLHGTGKTR